ncbi:hypothetical protein SAMN04487894_103173 [Niabella drilacis]|uniref:N-acetyltransferase domain-containing protein n=2 Tax=Niabella drilacis (strain DSM 25811 / CCM 8410 / CCUG 62505 / LMG 26954 / E90) TaxID=1285928 RepID=A0A1G6N8J2_NIADE|nr:hypothetical protein SAMN04487894_103173 [Niabella drilacis]
MRVSIIRIEDKRWVNARIESPSHLALTSLNEGWRFNFKKNTLKEKLQTFVLICEETPDIIEGCLSFKMKDTIEPYMAYVEIAPHNKGRHKRYEQVAGCLIAFACRLSFIHGAGAYKGWLAFDVFEENKEDEIKLMAVYCKKYGAVKFGDTTMLISPEAGEHLINKYLKNINHEQGKKRN